MLKATTADGAEALTLQGCVVHGILDHILDRFGRSSAATSPSWTAHAAVLAQLLRWHAEDERENLFSMIRERLTAAQRTDLAWSFLTVQDEIRERAMPMLRSG